MLILGDRLPDDGPTRVAGVELPAGRRWCAPPAPGAPSASDPVFWATDGAVDQAGEVWLELSKRRPDTDLVPLLLTGHPDDPQRPWGTGELYPEDVRVIDQLEAAAVLYQRWNLDVPGEEADDEDVHDLLEPFNRLFPGLALKERKKLPEAELADTLKMILPARIGLVVAARPADALAVMGWIGAANYYDDPTPVAAVLRSWEDRFGATLIGVGFDSIRLLVERPPRTEASALAVAVEHFALCPDIVRQDAGSLRAHAERLIDAPVWTFWWD